jgi:hypothetical protein
MQPTRHQFTILKQTCDLIPPHLIARLAREHGVEDQSRTFTPWSHTVSLMFAQISHALSLNDVCDTLDNHSGVLTTIRHASAPSRNGLSHANRERNADMAESLFWKTLEHFQQRWPQFGMGHRYVGLPRRFRKRIINVVDSTTIKLVANCMGWAKHRRRKAAAKCHMRLNLESFLPRFAVVKAANSHDAKEARAVCADILAGEIVAFDKAYVDFVHLRDLDKRGVFWVSRAKTNMQYEVIREHSSASGRILRDVVIRLTGTRTGEAYPDELRLVTARVEVNGREITLTFMTNNFAWAASSVCDLYKARWGIEVFFKQIKQTLQLGDFLGYNENAVRWQIWTALLTYVLLRFIAFMGKWTHSFARLFTLLRGTLWECYDLFALLERYGTASPPPRCRAAPEQAYLPGLNLL